MLRGDRAARLDCDCNERNGPDALAGPGGADLLGGLRIAEPGTALPTCWSRSTGPMTGGDRPAPRASGGRSGIDPVQTAAIIPGVFRSVAIPMKNFPVSARWAPIYRAISGCVGNACGTEEQGFHQHGWRGTAGGVPRQARSRKPWRQRADRLQARQGQSTAVSTTGRSRPRY